MSNNQNAPQSGRNCVRITSKTYDILKQEASAITRATMVGKAAYVDIHGNVKLYSVTDPKVVSGEVTSLTMGRKIPPRTADMKRMMSENAKKRLFNPLKRKSLYFLDMKIEVLFHTIEYVELLEQGWSPRATHEYRSALSLLNNINRSVESRKAAGRSISAAVVGKNKPKWSTERILKTRKIKSGQIYQPMDYYDTDTSTFVSEDPLYAKPTYVLVTDKSDRTVFDANSKRRVINASIPTPPGYFDRLPTKKFRIFDSTDQKIKLLEYRYLSSDHIQLSAPNTDRIKYTLTETGQTIYLPKTFVLKYGLPVNVR